MNKLLTLILAPLLLVGLFALSPSQPASAHSPFSHPFQDEVPTETPPPTTVTPADIINAVNSLRLLNGLNALSVHPVLMEVAAEQANALAASEGAIGHERPCGMTLGQDLLARGFPLLGDLSLDGYRSENWVTAATLEQAMAFWKGDAEHMDTMVDPNRSHIGAAVAVSDQVYMVLETALSTSSGQMQYDAFPILTGIPMTQGACYGMYTQAAQYGVSDQYSFPVIVSTPLPNGDVIHEVKYGQTLWSIAIQYKTTIAEIKRLNRLYSDVIAPGQVLVVKTGVITTPATVNVTVTPGPTTKPIFTYIVSTSTPAPTPTIIASKPIGQTLKENGMVIVALVVSFSVLLAGLGVVGKKRPH